MQREADSLARLAVPGDDPRCDLRRGNPEHLYPTSTRLALGACGRQQGCRCGGTTTLATGRITATDELTIELVEPLELPAAIVIRWPERPTAATPGTFDHTAAAAMSILAAATIELAALRVWKKGL
jgi:hypothetical protein